MFCVFLCYFVVKNSLKNSFQTAFKLIRVSPRQSAADFLQILQLKYCFYIFSINFYHKTMNLRSFLFILVCLLFIVTNISAFETEYFYVGKEPLVRVGLSTNASSVSITTTDSQLVAVSDGEANKFLATNKISVAARALAPRRLHARAGLDAVPPCEEPRLPLLRERARAAA